MPADAAELVRSIPVAAFAHRAGGEVDLVIGTDAGEWLALTGGERLVALPSTGPVSDMIEAEGTVTVACWAPVLKQLRDGAWSDLALRTPATALAMTPSGLVIADTGCGLSVLRGSSRPRAPAQELVSSEPLVSLLSREGGLVALGTSGALEATSWPGIDDRLTAIHTGPIGRAHAIFAGMRRGTALVAGARGLAVLDDHRLAAVTTELGDRISGACVFGGRGRAFVYGDGGAAWIVDERLVSAARVRLGKVEVAGAAPGADGTVLVWTTDGALHVVGDDGATWRITDGGVVLAVPEPADARGSIAIHWTEDRGARVTRGHIAWN